MNYSTKYKTKNGFDVLLIPEPIGNSIFTGILCTNDDIFASGSYEAEAKARGFQFGWGFACSVEDVVRKCGLVAANPFPKRMLVWDSNVNNKVERTVLADLGEQCYSRYVAVGSTYEESFKNGGQCRVTLWNNAENIDAEEGKLEVSFDEVAKKFGVESKNLKILK